MTSHYASYYKSKTSAPGDWYDPVPVPFLTVAAGHDFHFAVVPRPGGDAKGVGTAVEWLKSVSRITLFDEAESTVFDGLPASTSQTL